MMGVLDRYGEPIDDEQPELHDPPLRRRMARRRRTRPPHPMPAMQAPPGKDTDVLTDHPTTELRCAAADCTRWHIVQTKHLDNVLAAGPWRCPDHQETS